MEYVLIYMCSLSFHRVQSVWHEQWGMFSSMSALFLSLQGTIRVAGTMGDVLIYVCSLSLFIGYNPCGMNNGGGVFSSMSALSLSLFTGYNLRDRNNGGCSHRCVSLSSQGIIRVA